MQGGRFGFASRFRALLLGSASYVTTAILYGQQSFYSTGISFDYEVNNVTGDDANPGTAELPLRSPSKAHELAAAAGGNKKIGMHETGVDYLDDPIFCTTDGIGFYGYNGGRPNWHGALNVTGWTACTAADATLLGSIWPDVFKVAVPVDTTGANPNAIQHTAFNALTPQENGQTLNLAQMRRDRTDLFFQDAVKNFYSTVKGDTLDIGVTADANGYATTVTHAAVLGAYTDAQLAPCAIMLHASPNKAVFVEVDSVSGGVLTLQATTFKPESSPYGDCYSLLNIPAEMRVGEYSYVPNGDGTVTLYVRPNDPANMAAGIKVAARKNIITFSQCDRPALKGINFGMTSDDMTAANQACVVLDRTTNGQVTQCLFELCNVQAFGTTDGVSNFGPGCAGLLVIGGTDNVVQYPTVKNMQNNFGIFFNNVIYPASGNRLLNFYCSRVSLSPWRLYGQKQVAIVDGLMEDCCQGAHPNKGNLYLGGDQYLWWRLIYRNCPGYLTNQETSQGLIGMCWSPAPPDGTDARAFADQTNQNIPPTDPSNNYIINSFFEKPDANTGTGGTINVNVLTATENPTQGTSAQVKWGIWNNIVHGIDVEPTLQLAGSPDYNIDTKAAPLGANSVYVGDLDSIYYDHTAGNYNTVPGSVLTTFNGKDVTAIVEAAEAVFPDIDLRKTIDGKPWEPAIPGPGPYGKFWPVQADTTPPVLAFASAPTISGASASVTMTTSERGGTIAWGRYTPGTEPPADRGDLVLQGLDKDGNPALSSGSVGVPNPGVQLPFTVNGSTGETDTLAVVHRDRNLNVSAVVSASLAFEAFTPNWVAFDGVHFLRRSLALTGFQPATKKVVFAITLKRSAAQLGVTSSGGLIVANGSSDSVPTWTLGGTSKLQFIQETNANLAFANLVVPPATNMVADTEYLLIGTIYADGTNSIEKIAMFNIATGAQLGTTASTGLLADAAFTFKNNYDIFKGAATYERFMLWDNPSIAAPDATDATLRGYFMSGGALLDPSVARSALGAPLIDPDLTTGTNRGSGGNFTMT